MNQYVGRVIYRTQLQSELAQGIIDRDYKGLWGVLCRLRAGGDNCDLIYEPSLISIKYFCILKIVEEIHQSRENKFPLQEIGFSGHKT